MSAKRRAIQKFANEFVKKNRSVTAHELMKAIKKVHPWYSRSERTASELLREALLSIDEVIEVDVSESTDSVEAEVSVDQDGYVISSKVHGVITVTIDMADQLFYEFSQHGKNLTQTQIINKHGFTPSQWMLIKNRLGIYKLSNIFSPWRLENTPKDQIEEMIQSKIESALHDKHNIDNQYKEAVSKAEKKQINESQRRDLAKQVLITELVSYVQQLPVENLSIKRNKKSSGDPIVVATADWHVGARVENLHKTMSYNPEIIKEYIDMMAETVNMEESSDVTLIINGDIIESFTGQNHKNSFQSMEFGYYGSKAIVEAHKAILGLCSQIENCKRILITSGNHDRWSEDNKFDQRGEVAEIISYMLKLSLGNNIEVVHDYSIISMQINNINFIVSHGHNRKENLKPEKLIFDYGKQDVFNVVLLAHLHSRSIHHEIRQYRVLRIPSLFSGNHYSEELGFNTLPGFLIIKTGFNYRPIITDHPLSIEP
jgi:predicted phosphodiesterase